MTFNKVDFIWALAIRFRRDRKWRVLYEKLIAKGQMKSTLLKVIFKIRNYKNYIIINNKLKFDIFLSIVSLPETACSDVSFLLEWHNISSAAQSKQLPVYFLCFISAQLQAPNHLLAFVHVHFSGPVLNSGACVLPIDDNKSAKLQSIVLIKEFRRF